MTELRADIARRLRRLPGTVLLAAAFTTWGLAPFLAGLDRVLALVTTGAW